MSEPHPILAIELLRRYGRWWGPRPQYAVEWQRWHYDTPEWVRVKKLFAAKALAQVEQKTMGVMTTRVVKV